MGPEPDRTEGRKGSGLATFLHEWALACVVSAIMLPGAIAVATLTLFLSAPTDGAHHWDDTVNRTPTRCVFFGVLVAFAFCLLLAVVALRRFTRADASCPEVFAELKLGQDRITKRLDAVCDADGSRHVAVYNEAAEHRRHLDTLLEQPSRPGLPWLVGSGYLDAWRRLHAVDGAMMLLDPAPLVVSGALDDEMRLQGSSIPQSAVLQSRLRCALGRLSSTAQDYFVDPSSQHAAGSSIPQSAVRESRLRRVLERLSSTTRNSFVGPSSEHSVEAPATDQATADEARAVLAQVRSAITEFRDTSREGLVHARNRLFATVLFEGLTGCVLFVVAILSGASQSEITAAAAFYLVAGIVGLVKQLQVAATSVGVAEPDYGLSIVRLIQTPLLSGLAGVGGVVLVQLASGQTQGQPSFSLSTTFDLGKNPYGLVAAALFGLAPTLFLSGLQRRIDQYKSDLSSSGAGQSHQPNGV